MNLLSVLQNIIKAQIIIRDKKIYIISVHANEVTLNRGVKTKLMRQAMQAVKLPPINLPRKKIGNMERAKDRMGIILAAPSAEICKCISAAIIIGYNGGQDTMG